MHIEGGIYENVPSIVTANPIAARANEIQDEGVTTAQEAVARNKRIQESGMVESIPEAQGGFGDADFFAAVREGTPMAVSAFSGAARDFPGVFASEANVPGTTTKIEDAGSLVPSVGDVTGGVQKIALVLAAFVAILIFGQAFAKGAGEGVVS